MNGITDESIAAMATVLRFSTGPGIVVLDPVLLHVYKLLLASCLCVGGGSGEVCTTLQI